MPGAEAGDLDARFGAAMAALGPFGPSPRLALAVSGGPDSLALMLLAARWAAGSGASLTILTVDHRLRPESGAEAAAVARWARGLDLDHVTLAVPAALPAGDLEAAARTARYRLMADWCAGAGVLHLLTGHSQDDQAETLLMRLMRGSGLDGLSAMAPAAVRGGVRLLRPLLDFPRAALVAVVAAAGLAAHDDPMNGDPRFLRVATRQAMAGLGLDRAGLAATAARLRRDRAVLDRATIALMAEAVSLSAWGVGRIRRAGLLAAPAPVAERAVARLILAVGGGAYPPRRDRLDRLMHGLRSGAPLAAATLGGCRLSERQGVVRLCREGRGLGPDLTLAAGAAGRWDNRFTVAAHRDVTIRALGDAAAPGLPRLPRAERAALPAVFAGESLIAVPAVHFGDPKAASLRYRPVQSISG